MLPTQTIEELISVSYVSAIIAHAGYSPNAVSKDYGVDLEVRRVAVYDNKRIDLGPMLELQLKASINWELESEHVVYDIEAEAFNRLVFQRDNAFVPCALVLCCLPKNQSEWLDTCEDEMRLRKCCYYYFVSGEETTNVSTKRLRIPRNQLVGPSTFDELRATLYEGALR